MRKAVPCRPPCEPIEAGRGQRADRNRPGSRLRSGGSLSGRSPVRRSWAWNRERVLAVAQEPVEQDADGRSVVETSSAPGRRRAPIAACLDGTNGSPTGGQCSVKQLRPGASEHHVAGLDVGVDAADLLKVGSIARWLISQVAVPALASSCLRRATSGAKRRARRAGRVRHLPPPGREGACSRRRTHPAAPLMNSVIRYQIAGAGLLARTPPPRWDGESSAGRAASRGAPPRTRRAVEELERSLLDPRRHRRTR